MGSAPSTLEPHSLYELSWTYAQDGKIAIDAGAGTILDANPAMEALMGYSRAELIGMQVTMLHPEAERERVKVEIRKAALKGSPHPGFHIQRKDGSLASVAIWSSESLKPGSGPILIVEFRDLTAHNDREEHLVRMEARYRGLLEAAPDGIVVVNQGGEIVLLNSLAEKQFGYRRDELLGQKVTSIIPEGFAERLIADGTRTAAEALAQQIGTGIELVALRKDGSEFPIEIMLSPLESAEGILVTAAIRDITAQKEREHRLIAQNWALSAYAGAALALAPASSSEELLKAICEAITRQSIYVLAFAGIAEDGQEKKIRVAAEAGSAVSFLHGMDLSWSERDPDDRSPSGICIRTNKLQIIADTETSDVFAPWRERASRFGIRSSIYIPLRVEGGWQGELAIYAALPNAFEAPEIEVFQHLAEQIVHGVHALNQGLGFGCRTDHPGKYAKEVDRCIVRDGEAHGGRDGNARPLHGGSRDPSGGYRSRNWQRNGLARGAIAWIVCGGTGPRYRKDFNSRRNPDQADQAHRGRMGIDSRTPGDRLHHSERHSISVADCRDRAPTS